MRSMRPSTTDAAPTVLKVQDLQATYDSTVVLDRISFEVRAGEVFFIIGGSGCGKSTLLKHLIGLYRPARGHVFIRDVDISAASGEGLKRILRHIGVTYQSGALFGSLNLRENVRLPLEEFTALPRDAMDLIARMRLRLVGLEDYAEHLPSEVSGGMQKRAALARALALDPSILFLDEPSAGLDPVTLADLDQLIASLSRNLGVTFVIVSHELASIFSIAHRVIMLDKETKTIIAEGAPGYLRDHSDHPQVRQFFQRRPGNHHGERTETRKPDERKREKRTAGESAPPGI